MERYFKIIGNTRYDHAFETGKIVSLVKIFPDGVFVVEGEYFRSIITQDVHPVDLEEIQAKDFPKKRPTKDCSPS